jgi:hypothetical protein
VLVVRAIAQWVLQGLLAAGCLFLTIAAVRFWRNSLRRTDSPARTRDRLLALRNLAIVIGGGLILSIGIEDLMAAVLLLWLLALIVMLPAAEFIQWRLGRQSMEQPSGPWKRWALASQILAIFSWLASVMTVVFVVVLFQLWPLSLRDGPNTRYASAGFEKTFGEPPPESVTRIYYRNFGVWQDHEIFVKFHYEDRAVVDEIVAKLGLNLEAESTAHPRIIDKFPGRWIDETPEAVEGPYRKEEPTNYWYLWIDRQNQTVYYYEFNT